MTLHDRYHALEAGECGIVNLPLETMKKSAFRSFVSEKKLYKNSWS